MGRRLIAAALMGLGAVLPAIADDLAPARAAYAEGRFLEAADLAAAFGTSAGHAYAAMCLAYHGHYLASDDDKAALFERAAALAEEAIRLDPDHADAYLQLVHAIGRQARTMGALKALREGVGGRSLELLQAALERDPDDPVTHVSLGGWHADVVAQGFLARAMFKQASREDAVKHYERALELAPDSILVRLEYARRLPKLDRRGGRERARTLLSEAAATPARDFYDGLLHEEVRQELAALD